MEKREALGRAASCTVHPHRGDTARHRAGDPVAGDRPAAEELTGTLLSAQDVVRRRVRCCPAGRRRLKIGRVVPPRSHEKPDSPGCSGAAAILEQNSA
jgi:hypothetical protein